MNPMLVHVEDANQSCMKIQREDGRFWVVSLSPVVPKMPKLNLRRRRRRLERRISQEVYDRQRIDRVLNEIVEHHADLLC